MRPAAGRALMGLAVLVMISSGVGQWAAVAGGKMYWTDLGIGKIQRVNLDGTGLQDLVTTGLRFPRGMAVDDSGGKMYWMDGGTLKVHRANLDGSQVEDLVTGQPVVHEQTLLPPLHEPMRVQQLQVLRGVRLPQPRLLHQLAHRLLPPAQRVEDVQPRRLGGGGGPARAPRRRRGGGGVGVGG
jgi:hypothetical protein